MHNNLTGQVINMFCMPDGSGVLCIGGSLPVFSSMRYTNHPEACGGPFPRQSLVYVMIQPLSFTAGERLCSHACVPKSCREGTQTRIGDPYDCNANKHSVRSGETFGLECIQ